MATSPISTLPVKKRRRARQVKCIAYPNRARKRQYTPADVGRLVCRVIGQGSLGIAGTQRTSTVGIQAELRAEINKCMPCEDSVQQKSPTQAVAALAQSALAVVQENATIIAVAIAILGTLLILPRLIPFLPRAALALLPTVARVGITQIPGILARLRATQAANDSFFRVLQGLARAA